uniref:Ankyrin repeat protein n=1 Tax=Panagrolaimus sp. PS1159 TaxID=55785 RepID=A0AC35EWH9_9BILA
MIKKNEISYKVITSVRRYETPYSNKAARSITLLHKAAWLGEKRTAKWLTEKGADIDVKDNFGYTPKMLAEENNQTEIIAFLERFVLSYKLIFSDL